MTTATITGPSGLSQSGVVIRYASQATPTLYCGTIGRGNAQTGAGTITVTLGSGYVAGALADGSTSGGFAGRLTTGEIDAAGNWPAGGTARVAGSMNSLTGALSGFWDMPGASGQWAATTGACK